MNPKPMKAPKKAMLKARCEEDLASWYCGMAYLRKLDVADVVRYALRDYQQRATAATNQTLAAPADQHRVQ